MTYIREDFYSDDPIEDSANPVKKKFSSILALVLLLVGGTYLTQTTLAANISLNSGSSVQFGQGVSATTTCSGATNLTITPVASFSNSSGGGSHIREIPSIFGRSWQTPKSLKIDLAVIYSLLREL